VDHVGLLRAQVQLDGPIDREPEYPRGDRSLGRVREAPRELLAGHVDPERVGAGVPILGEDDRADDRDRDHEHRRDGRPGDLEPGVAVDRLSVGVVVGADPEFQQRVDDHCGDDREDRDADHRYEPEDEVDPPGLAARRRRQPAWHERESRRDAARDEREQEKLDDRTPAHRPRDYSKPRLRRHRKRRLRNTCNERNSSGASSV
jgi:hypothetical protein